MKNRVLRGAVAGVFINHSPGLADAIRRLRDAGQPKSAVVAVVTRKTAHSQFMRAGLLTMVDAIWQERPSPSPATPAA